jgi:hypothetical protein
VAPPHEACPRHSSAPFAALSSAGRACVSVTTCLRAHFAGPLHRRPTRPPPLAEEIGSARLPPRASDHPSDTTMCGRPPPSASGCPKRHVRGGPRMSARSARGCPKRHVRTGPRTPTPPHLPAQADVPKDMSAQDLGRPPHLPAQADVPKDTSAEDIRASSRSRDAGRASMSGAQPISSAKGGGRVGRRWRGPAKCARRHVVTETPTDRDCESRERSRRVPRTRFVGRRHRARDPPRPPPGRPRCPSPAPPNTRPSRRAPRPRTRDPADEPRAPEHATQPTKPEPRAPSPEQADQPACQSASPRAIFSA